MAKKNKDEDDSAKRGLPFTKIALAAMVGVVVYTQVLAGGGGGAEAATETTIPDPVPGAVVEVGEVRATLADEDPSVALVRVSVQLEAGVAPEEITDELALLQEAVVSEVSALYKDQLKGTEGFDRLKGLLTARAEELYNVEGEQVTVMQVVVTELIVQ